MREMSGSNAHHQSHCPNAAAQSKTPERMATAARRQQPARNPKPVYSQGVTKRANSQVPEAAHRASQGEQQRRSRLADRELPASGRHVHREAVVDGHHRQRPDARRRRDGRHLVHRLLPALKNLPDKNADERRVRPRCRFGRLIAGSTFKFEVTALLMHVSPVADARLFLLMQHKTPSIR